MILTQEDAATLGCPLRVVRRAMTEQELAASLKPTELVNGTIPMITGFAPCLHARCMAWRWEDPGMDSRKLPGSFRTDDGPRGYCGLGGIPRLLS
jgi:hypothetical protein